MLTAIALILLGMVLLLAAPVEIAFNIEHDEASRSDISLVMLFGIIRIPLVGHSGKERRKKTARTHRKKTKRRGNRKVMSLARNADFRERFFNYIRGLLQSMKIKTLDVQVKLGLDDPADTGRLWGVVGPLASVLAESRTARIRIEPEFAGEVFSLQSHGRISVTPLRILSNSLYFFLSPQVIRVIAFRS